MTTVLPSPRKLGTARGELRPLKLPPKPRLYTRPTTTFPSARGYSFGPSRAVSSRGSQSARPAALPPQTPLPSTAPSSNESKGLLMQAAMRTDAFIELRKELAAHSEVKVDLSTAAMVLQEQEASRARFAAAREKASQRPPPPPTGWDAPELKGALRDSAPSWWPVPPTYASASEAFDRRHIDRALRAERLLAHVLHDQTSTSKAMHFEECLFEVYTNRFVKPYVREEIKVYTTRLPPMTSPAAAGAPTTKKPKDHMIIWSNRARWADSKSIYDTPEVKRAKLDIDYARALDECKLDKFILQHDDEYVAPKGGKQRAAKDDMQASLEGEDKLRELREVKDALWAYHDSVIMIFDIYAALGGDSVHEMSLNEWSELVRDFELADNSSKYCKKADLDRLFIAVDAASNGDFAKDKQLNRIEFLTCLVRLAVLKYVKTGKIPDVSDAVETFLANDIAPHCDPTIMGPTDEFRREQLYTLEVCEVLMKYESSLRTLFNAVGRIAKTPGSRKLGLLLGVAEWKTLVRRLELVDYDLTDRDTTLCFICSRMAVVDSGSAHGEVKESSLPFEGFLEAICRAALLKAWPTPAEIDESDYNDAGAFIRNHRRDDPAKHKEMCEERAVAWGVAPSIPTYECVTNMIMLIIQTIEEQAVGDSDAPAKSGGKMGVDMKITDTEMAKWNKLWKQM